MTIQEKCRKLNINIHNRIFKTNHFTSSFGHYEKCFTSLDLIEDCQDAIDEFIEIPESNIRERSVLYIYGVLQSLFCQQDGLQHLYNNISNTKISINDFFIKFEFNKKTREIRNEIAGHPTSRKNSEFYFIDKGPNFKYKFCYHGYNPDFKTVNVDLKKIITEQTDFVHKVLSSVETLVEKAMKKNIDEHSKQNVYSLISNLNYSIQLIKRGLSDSKRLFQAESSIKIVKKNISSFIEELNKRYNSEIPESILYTYYNIEYILNKIENWLIDGELHKNMDGKIFMIAFDKEFSELIQMAKEIDIEYAK